MLVCYILMCVKKQLKRGSVFCREDTHDMGTNCLSMLRQLSISGMGNIFESSDKYLTLYNSHL